MRLFTSPVMPCATGRLAPQAALQLFRHRLEVLLLYMQHPDLEQITDKVVGGQEARVVR